MDLATGNGGKTTIIKLLSWKACLFPAQDMRRTAGDIVKEAQLRKTYWRSNIP